MPVIKELVAAFARNVDQNSTALDESLAAIDQRLSPNPALAANLAFRVMMAILGTMLCWVPLKLLWRNGDFAASCLIVVVTILNVFTSLNSIIWSSDNWNVWWDGAGLCDIQIYLQQALYTAFAASIFAIIHHLAEQVRLDRATPVDREERGYIIWSQIAIIFPIPLIQVLFTYFDISQRYKIGTLVGCMPVYDVSWPRVLLYEAPTPAFVYASVPYAVTAFKRYWTILKITRGIVTSNSAASARAWQSQCRLYALFLSILAVYFPVSVYYMALNIRGGMEANFKPYDLDRIHNGNNPYPWDAITFVPSWMLPNSVINQPWIPIATSIAIVLFYGTTQDGLDMYREYAAALGRVFWRPRQASNVAANPGPIHNDDVGDEYTIHEHEEPNWIALSDLSPAPRRENTTPNSRHDGRRNAIYRPYPFLSSPVDESLIPAPLNLPNRPRTPGRPLPPTPLTLDDTSRLPVNTAKQTSPLTSTRVIAPFIPNRRSSLYFQEQSQQSQEQQTPTALRGPAGNLSRITETPDLNRNPGRDIISPWLASGRRIARVFSENGEVRSPNSPDYDPDHDSSTGPILPSQSGQREWVHYFPDFPDESPYRGESSPRTLETVDSTMHKTSRDIVQPRNMIGDWADSIPAPNVATTHAQVKWPFFSGSPESAEESGSSPAPSVSSSAASPSNQKGEEKEKTSSLKDKPGYEEENSFTRHRDDPPSPDPWDSPPDRLAPGLEAIRPRRPGYQRKRMPRGENINFDDYIKPKESPKETSKETSKESPEKTPKKGKEPEEEAESGNDSGFEK
ncbi:pheromone A receptor-domain-containing protein [Hypoxylon rubiginosum]|uniref:Pheromone A receptor-domain-containing protein n=1 Tax=Hypoxylon rubiginosum TaxID=110542 RepID=A0ACC0DIH0_9PEZI|nr:pheromone A receptor-domain-containing protein [Hypoxylon rubiginosum]